MFHMLNGPVEYIAFFYRPWFSSWGKEFHSFATASAQGGFEAADQSVLNEDCYVRFYLSVVLKYHQCHSTGSGHNEFSCVSSKKIRDTLCKEHTGNFFSLAGCTGRHEERKIIALSSWPLMRSATLLLVGTFAIVLVVSRTAFLS